MFRVLRGSGNRRGDLEDYARTLLWGCVAVALFAVAALLVFCFVTEGIFQSDACQVVMMRLHGIVGWFGR